MLYVSSEIDEPNLYFEPVEDVSNVAFMRCLGSGSAHIYSRLLKLVVENGPLTFCACRYTHSIFYIIII